jgi:hypothetical protein
MFRFFSLMLVFSIYLFSDMAFAAMQTAEKWVCVRDEGTRVLRLYAPAKGEAPCKVFYFKRNPADPTDAIMEAEQNSGDVRPIYYSTGNGGFCVRKLDAFKAEKEAQGWHCVK